MSSSKTRQKLEQIHRKLWDKSHEEEPERQVTKKDFKIIIGDVVGFDKRTRRKYEEQLKIRDIIDDIPNTQRFKIIEEPEQPDELELTGERISITTKIDRGLKKQAEILNIDINAVVTEALADAVKDKEDYVEQVLGYELESSEIEFIYALLRNDLYGKKGDKKQQAKRDRQRERMYEQNFDVERVTSEDFEHIEKLRRKAFKIAEDIGLKQPYV